MTTISEIIAARIKQARTMKGWSRAELAALAGLSASSIARYESGKVFISDDVLVKIAGAFKLRLSFFFESKGGFIANKNFQTIGNLTKREQNQVIETIKGRVENLVKAIGLFDDRPIPVFELQAENILSLNDAFDFAVSLSRKWGITHESNLIKTIESKGILFVEVEGVTVKFNGLTATINGFPVIAVNSKTPSQQRMAISHELAHLLGIESEELCDAFSRGIPEKDEHASDIEKSSLLEDLVWEAWSTEIIYHNKAARLLGMSESDFQELVEVRIEKD